MGTVYSRYFVEFVESRVFRRVTLPRIVLTAGWALPRVSSTVNVGHVAGHHLISRFSATSSSTMPPLAEEDQQDFMQCPGAGCPEIIPRVIACTGRNRGKYFCRVRHTISPESLTPTDVL